MKEKSKMSNVADHKGDAKAVHETKIQHVPFSQILIDDAWNARHINHAKDSDSVNEDVGTAKGIPSLADSIQERGQDTPAILRLNPDEKTKGKKPYMLVTGNRRAMALLMLAQRSVSANDLTPIKSQPDWNAKDPYIRAEVKSLTETEALMLNMAENTARDDMPASDLAFGVHRLLQAYKADKNGAARGSNKQIALALGKSEAYIGRLVKIMTTLDSKITDHWRTMTKPVPVQAMFDLCDDSIVRPEERWNKYAKLSGQDAGTPTTTEGGVAGTPESEKTPLESMCAAYRKACIQLGVLHQLGFVDCEQTPWSDQIFIANMITVKQKELGKDVEKWRLLAKAGKDGFEAGCKEVLDKAEVQRAKELKKAGKEADPKTGSVVTPAN